MRQIMSAALLLLCPFFIKAQTVELAETDSAGLANSNEIVIETPVTEFKASHNFLKKNSAYLVPTAMFGFGVMAVNNPALQNFDIKIRDGVVGQPTNSNGHRVEDFLQYTPAYSVFALNAIGVKSQHKMFDRLALYGISNTIMSHTVAKMKSAFGKLRPDGSNNRSFPSGHTATAFQAAEFMRLEYKNESPIYGIAAYAAAATTGALRIYHNSHWFSDVVAGAGIGILSTQLTYFVYPKVKNFVSNKLGFKNKNLKVGPSYQNGAAGFALVYNPK